jgi:hypothetical protein
MDFLNTLFALFSGGSFVGVAFISGALLALAFALVILVCLAQ